jgi:hypothetical protein
MQILLVKVRRSVDTTKSYPESSRSVLSARRFMLCASHGAGFTPWRVLRKEPNRCGIY